MIETKMQWYTMDEKTPPEEKCYLAFIYRGAMSYAYGCYWAKERKFVMYSTNKKDIRDYIITMIPAEDIALWSFIPVPPNFEQIIEEQQQALKKKWKKTFEEEEE